MQLKLKIMLYYNVLLYNVLLYIYWGFYYTLNKCSHIQV